MKSTLLFAVFALLFSACGGLSGSVKPKETPSNTRVFISVEQDTILAPGYRDELAGKLREILLESRAGVPVTNRQSADLELKVNVMDVNFTQATQWDWQLIHIKSGALLVSESDSSAFGSRASTLASAIVGRVSELDTAQYAANTVATPTPEIAAPAETSTMPSSKTPGENAWAVVIGIENYREKLSPATGAEADAREFAALVRDTLNVPETNIKVLVGQRATRADISAVLMEWLPRNAVQDGGRVYVFFSGHGAPDVETGDAYLVPWDANPTYLKTGGIKVADIQTTLKGMKGQDVFVFLDACFSGHGERTVLAEGTRPVVPVKALDGHVVTFAAAGADETTGAHSESGRGLFSHHLLGALKGDSDTNGDGNITVAEIKTHVVEAVRLDARRQNRDQTPTVATPGPDVMNAELVRGLSN